MIENPVTRSTRTRNEKLETTLRSRANLSHTLANHVGIDDRKLDVGGTQHRHLGQFAANHGHFITGMEARAIDAILVDLVRHVFTRGRAESEEREEIRDA